MLWQNVGQIRTVCHWKRREGALLLPAVKCFKFVPFFGEFAGSYVSALEFYVIVNACCRKETSPFPTVKTDRLYAFQLVLAWLWAGKDWSERPGDSEPVTSVCSSESTRVYHTAMNEKAPAWLAGRTGGCHASDVGLLFAMTCSVRGFFITMTILLGACSPGKRTGSE